MTERRVRTVLGDVPADRLGPTDYHEHLFQVSPMLKGEELDDEDASRREAGLLRRSGASAMVEATPVGLGADPAGVARISAATGLLIVHATGMHREAHYGSDHPAVQMTEKQLRDRFTRDLVVGMRSPAGEPAWAPDGFPIRAGVLKAGVGLWAVSGFERRVMTTVAGVADDLDVPVMVHLEHGSAAHEVLDLLEAEGCPCDRVALAHMDRNPDPGLMLDLAARGAYLGFDGAARHQYWPDSVLIECMTQVVAGGGGERLLLGGDVARRSRYSAYGGMPGLQYLFDRYVPRVRTAVGAEALNTILVSNPARWLAWVTNEPDIREGNASAQLVHRLRGSG